MKFEDEKILECIHFRRRPYTVKEKINRNLMKMDNHGVRTILGLFEVQRSKTHFFEIYNIL